jgi:hypothetical protein
MQRPLMRHQDCDEDQKTLPPHLGPQVILGRVDFFVFPIDPAGTTLTATLKHLTAAFSAIRPHVEQAKASKGAIDRTMDHNAKIHDFSLFRNRNIDISLTKGWAKDIISPLGVAVLFGLFKSLMDSLTDLAHSRLVGFIVNRKRIVYSLRGEVSCHRAHSAAPPSHTLAARQRTTTHTHWMREDVSPPSTPPNNPRRHSPIIPTIRLHWGTGHVCDLPHLVHHQPSS